jgi:ABC-type glycerol-3-phosphate transport system substrate-binding protein
LEASLRDGRLYSLPVLLETSILAYNKRIFAAYGVKAAPDYAGTGTSGAYHI